MPKNQPRNSLKPLSVGNVVTAAIQLFRSHLKQYLGLTLRAYLWALVPIYGWAKFFMISGVISRLAFGDLTGQPETETQARKQLEDKKWGFLGLESLLVVISIGVFIAWYIALIILVLIGVAIVSAVGENVVVIVALVLIAIVLVFLSLFGLTWFFSRFMVSQVAFAIEPLSNASASLGRSWELTKGYVLRIQGVLLIAFLMTLPLQIIAQVLALLAQVALSRFFTEGSSEFLIVSFFAGYAIGLGSGLFVFPFWQAIRTVIYYDVRNRREGLSLEIRDRSR